MNLANCQNSSLANFLGQVCHKYMTCIAECKALVSWPALPGSLPAECEQHLAFSSLVVSPPPLPAQACSVQGPHGAAELHGLHAGGTTSERREGGKEGG